MKIIIITSVQRIRQRLHAEYRTEKDNLFTPAMSIHHEDFMMTLGNIWGNWAPPKKIINAAKRVGISSQGLDVGWMQQDKFETAARLMTVPENSQREVTESPQGVRIGSAAYWKKKYKMKEMQCHPTKSISRKFPDTWPSILWSQKGSTKANKSHTSAWFASRYRYFEAGQRN